MKNKKLTVLTIIAAAVVLTIAATALASPNSIFAAESMPAAEAPAADGTVFSEAVHVSDVSYEIDSDTGEIRRDGEVVGSLDMNDGDAVVATMEGEDGQQVVTINSAGTDGLSYSITGSGETADGTWASYCWTDDSAE